MIKDASYIQENLIRKVLENDEGFLKWLYAEWRTDFRNWCKNRYQLSDSESAEIYQDTFLQLFLSIRERRVTELDHPKTYFYGIGKNLVRQHFKKSGRQFEELESADIPNEDHYLAGQVRTEERQEVLSVLDRFGDPCRKLLVMFYYEQYSHEVIAARMGYKNDQVVKKKKSICMSELRKMWKDYRDKNKHT
ncbi:MAG: RNA polymerase sigma factor [Bacteroidota bacterium]